ncbi:hypothetical protein KZO25_05160 [Halomonas sp. ANAO-440]|uniref:hypothetical protein n=1 Tax=Halomonas sp. ANAO-440 TaxID=2861360 RepID=UPI001CAA5C38|nr:hypothetical protein [Halomonas sp. ANAO-440]MBZ0329707.1 hypothetical protein [Halomonas sp. ANAO-440]
MFVAVEMLVLALPASVVCLFSSVVLFLTLGFPWSLMDLVVMHFVLIGMLGILGLWRVAVACIWNRQTWVDHEEALYWWWRAACLGAGLVGVSQAMFVLLGLGWDAPEWAIIIALGIVASPLLIPFCHLVYLRRSGSKLER